MITKLNSNPLFLEVSAIVIENQPALKNPRMKSIQMILYSYFLIKFNDNNIDVNINLVPANSKLKFNIKNDEIEKINQIKNKYMKGKKLAIEYCRHFIKDSDDKLTFFKRCLGWIAFLTRDKFILLNFYSFRIITREFIELE